MNVVSKSIRFVWIFVMFPREGVPNRSGVLENGYVTFPSKFPTLKPTLLYSNRQSLVGFSVILKYVGLTLNDL